MTHDRRPSISLGLSSLRLDDVVLLAKGRAQVVLDDEPEFRERIAGSRRALVHRLERGERVYGVTTGFGESCLTSVENGGVADLPHNLVRFHGCGTGALLTPNESAAVLAVRLASLVTGWSAVRMELLERLVDLLNRRILPQIPSEGSVGASGDLTPLSYVAAALIGEREVFFRGRTMPAAVALREAGVEPFRFEPKESLAIMNGTSVMTALVCLAIDRARRLARLASALTAMGSEVMRGNPGHFDDRLFLAKPHPGQRTAARWIREDLGLDPRIAYEGRIQDRYSIRCAPHVIGVLLDALPWMYSWTEIEVNGANDNPLIDPLDGTVLHGGNFYGGHPCFVADGLKNVVANIADLLDRQLALLCSPETNNGLPPNLVRPSRGDRSAHHGFKAMQISASALAAEALKLTMPASVFSRSTECHNQDKVSMGTIAARDCLRILDLTETSAAICVLAMCQAVELRGVAQCGPRARTIHQVVREQVAFNDGDRRQDRDISAVRKMIDDGSLPIGEADLPTMQMGAVR
ncbi:MAG: aromatic amino acid ammonia-lyase [Nannocystaceae bacterium]